MRAIISTVVVLPVMVLGLTATPTSVVSAQELVGEGQIAGTRVVVREIKRSDDGMLTLKFQLINEADKPRYSAQIIGSSVLTGAVHLIDAANKKKYLVVEDSSGRCVCAPLNVDVSKDRPVNLWAKFPAPPESVQKVTVVVTRFEPIESVPISAR